MPTVFGDDLQIDEAGQRALTEAALAWGVEGFTVLGVMGEAGTLNSQERSAVLSCVVEAAGGSVPVAVGCSAASWVTSAALAAEARALGAAFAMVSAPPLLKDVDALPGFFRRVKEHSGLPLLLQDEPAATGVTIPVSVIVECLHQSKTFVIKLEDPPTPTKISSLLARRSDMAIFGGLGGTMTYYELCRGAVGTMTGFSYPEILKAIRQALCDDNRGTAFEMYRKFLPLILFEAQPRVGLGIRKELLRRRGVIKNASTRIASPAVGEELKFELDEVLSAVGIVPASSPLQLGSVVNST